MNHDVVVIGAGPAGLSAAIAFARAGVSVLLCEQASEPGSKPCGEGLLPTAVAELVTLGVERDALFSAGRTLRGVRYVSPGGAEAAGQFAGPSGLGLRRSDLSRLLLELAASTPGLEYRQGSARVQCRSDRCSVRTGAGIAAPRLVVAADGLTSRTRRDAGLRWEQPRPGRYGARQHFGLAPWGDQVEVYFHASGEAYVTPVGQDELNVAVLWESSPELRPLSGTQLLPVLSERFPLLARRLQAAPALGRAQGRGPLRVRVPSPARNGLVLIGDAAGYVDAITGEGVGLSLAKSRLLAEHVVPLLKDTRGPIAASALKPYLRAAHRLERGHVQLTQALLWLRRSPWLLEQAVTALAHDPALFGHLLRANQGEVSPLAMPASSAWALGRSMLSLQALRAAS